MLSIRLIRRPGCVIMNHIHRNNQTLYFKVCFSDVGQVQQAKQMMKEFEKNRALGRRAAIKVPHSSNLSSDIKLYVLGSGGKGSTGSVFVATDYGSYMFNCGENAMKEFMELKYDVGKIKNYFFTYNAWNNVGGLMGCLLTKNMLLEHQKKVKIHGPPLINKAMRMSKYFGTLDRRIRDVQMYVFLSERTYEDSQVVIEYVILKPTPGSPECYVNDVRLKGGPKDNITLDKAPPEVSIPQLAVAYIINFKGMSERKIDLQKVVDLGLKSGPWVGELTRGNTVTVEGRTITPEEVYQDNNKPRPIVVLECPSVSFLDSLLSSDQLEDLTKTEDNVPQLIVHMTSKHIMKLPKYTDFMARFTTTTTKHLAMNEDCYGPYIHDSHILQAKLNLVHKDIFPLLKGHTDIPKKQESKDIVYAVPGLYYTIRPVPRQGYIWEDVKYYNKIKDETYFDKQLETELRKLWNELQVMDTSEVEGQGHGEKKVNKEVKVKDPAEEARQEHRRNYPEIVILGTGSSPPSPTRNSSGILVQTRKDEYLMLDCGEGTLVQMLQLYGEDKTNHILSNLKAIFITHLHHDHHGGFFSVLERRNNLIESQGREDEIYVFVPSKYKSLLVTYHKAIDNRRNYMHLFHHSFVSSRVEMHSNYSDRYKALKPLEILHADYFHPVKVDHISSSYGLVMTHKDGWKMVYSGDTMPCDDLIRYGKDCDILIHEATFAHIHGNIAQTALHSTCDEAIEVARKMRAKFTLLTHFSQRYGPALPIQNNHQDKTIPNVGFAYDFMTLRPSQWKLLPLFTPALMAMFPLYIQRPSISEFDKGYAEEKHKQIRIQKESVAATAGKWTPDFLQLLDTIRDNEKRDQKKDENSKEGAITYNEKSENHNSFSSYNTLKHLQKNENPKQNTIRPNKDSKQPLSRRRVDNKVKNHTPIEMNVNTKDKFIDATRDNGNGEKDKNKDTELSKSPIKVSDFFG